jgi:predicted ribosome-associated RNA-binding protein Tma20
MCKTNFSEFNVRKCLDTISIVTKSRSVVYFSNVHQMFPTFIIVYSRDRQLLISAKNRFP